MMNNQNKFLSKKGNQLMIYGEKWENFYPMSKPEKALLMIKKRIEDNVQYFDSLTKKLFPNSICAFATKVAPESEILKVIKKANNTFGIEVYNDKELKMAYEHGYEQIIVDGYYKPNDFLNNCIEHNVMLINITSIDEFIRLNEICKNKSYRQPVGIRIKATSDSKVGISTKELLIEIKNLKKYNWLSIEALHMHVGSNSQNFELNYSAFKELLSALNICKMENIEIKYLDIGGSYGERIIYGDKLENYLLSIKKMFSYYKNLVFIFEPGRAIVADAGLLISTVSSINHFDKIININITPSPFLFTTGATFMCAFPDYVQPDVTIAYSIAGIWPTANDIIKAELVKNIIPYSIKIGDYFIIYNAGAYVTDRLTEYSFDNIPLIYV